MRIALLGPLEVTDGSGRPVEVGGSRLRTLLTLLALDAGRVVTAERLIDGVWGEDPPSGAANALQSLVSRLRRALPGAPIDSQPSGYRLALDDDAIDVRRFDRLVARGRSLLPADPAGADAAKAHIEEALACSLRFGHHDDSSHLRARLAQAYTVLGEEARAREELRLALRGAERRGVPEDLAIVNFVYGEIARREGDLVTARARLEQAAAHSTGSGPPQFAATINAQLGSLHAQDGDLAAARERHAEGLRLAKVAHDAPVTGQVLVGFADMAQRSGEPERAATLLGAAVGIRGIEDRSLADPPRIERAVRAAIGDEAFAAAYASGRRMRLPEVDAYLGT